ncbi:MAG: exodeoxyribonuclease VII large subunit [Ruminococcaceae bacterium]|nr:exodeoxyribonuclease VII large subunit [Oscillospiraceae bacterium]
MERAGVFSVSQINEYIKMLLESTPVMSDLWVVGEISNFKNHYSTGHLYFSLKDEGSIIKCVMFRGNAQKLRFIPEDGMKVLLHGKISSYAPRGEYQIYADDMQPDGMGALAKAFEQLKLKLGAEGLFEQDHKKPIPKTPRRVGVITSASGAAIHDILNVSGRRSPSVEIVIYPAQVQGDTAPRSLCGGIKYFNERSPVDVIIIGRGGGSIEDLWAFNDEALARLIYESEIPVVSAVGHETDFTICDFVADMRAPTPSAAAEIVFPDTVGLLQKIRHLSSVSGVIIQKKLNAYRSQVSLLEKRTQLKSPEHVLNEKMMRVAALGERLEGLIQASCVKNKNKFALLNARLISANPLTLMSRGYAVVQKDGGVITKASQLSDGDSINIFFADGDVSAKVENIQKGE